MSAEERERTASEPREEFFDDAPTDTEVEDVGTGAPERKPLDAGKLRIVPKPLSLRQALDSIVTSRTQVAVVVDREERYRGILTLERVSKEIIT